jgi:hypothetical protein
MKADRVEADDEKQEGEKFPQGGEISPGRLVLEEVEKLSEEKFHVC